MNDNSPGTAGKMPKRMPDMPGSHIYSDVDAPLPKAPGGRIPAEARRLLRRGPRQAPWQTWCGVAALLLLPVVALAVFVAAVEEKRALQVQITRGQRVELEQTTRPADPDEAASHDRELEAVRRAEEQAQAGSFRQTLRNHSKVPLYGLAVAILLSLGLLYAWPPAFVLSELVFLIGMGVAILAGSIIGFVLAGIAAGILASASEFYYPKVREPFLG